VICSIDEQTDRVLFLDTGALIFLMVWEFSTGSSGKLLYQTDNRMLSQKQLSISLYSIYWAEGKNQLSDE